jgi:hypothetical protein
MIIDQPTMDVVKSVATRELWAKRKFGIPAIDKGPTMGGGHYLLAGPSSPVFKETNSNQFCDINLTGPPGSGSELMFKFLFQIPKWSYCISKVDEWIDVSPTNREYYERTMASKDALANAIKSGLASASSAISDYELVHHDLRRYKEIMGYFNQKTEHALKAMFIDQVDVHNGGGAMIQMVQRWPTIIHDFQRITDKDMEIDKIAKTLNIPKAEAVVLKTKNILYVEWKKLFKQAAVDRYERLITLAEARRKSIDEYRDWIKPYIVRFKKIKAGYADESARNTMLRSYIDVTGHATYTNFTRFWCWRYFTATETRRAPREQKEDFVIDPWDDFIRNEFVLDPRVGLASIYPWLLQKDPKLAKKNPDKCTIADKIANELKGKIKGGFYSPGMKPYHTYYMFIDLKIMRLGIRTPKGELEDITFKMDNYTTSANFILLKMIELRCREIQLERYINELLGLRTNDLSAGEQARKEFPNTYGVAPPAAPTPWEKYKKEIKDQVKSWTSWHNAFMKQLGKPKVPGKLMFFKPGKYEYDFDQRVAKGYLVPIGRYYHGTVEGFIKHWMGVPGF